VRQIGIADEEGVGNGAGSGRDGTRILTPWLLAGWVGSRAHRQKAGPSAEMVARTAWSKAARRSSDAQVRVGFTWRAVVRLYDQDVGTTDLKSPEQS
jgi:hypothetical protein